MKIDAVIFDMDGVIFDSERVSKRCWRVVATELGIPDSELKPAMLEITGANTRKAREVLTRRFSGYEGFEYDEFRKNYEDVYNGCVERGEVPLKPYVLELLGWLKEREIRTALASSTNREKVLRQLERARIRECFDSILCGDQVERGKPDPEIYIKSAEALGADPERTYAVEDSYNGIRSAKAAGLHPIMVPDLLPPTEEMNDMAEIILPDLGAVRDYLEERLG
ncbi:MAG: HAD family phosphatase [Clostridia bacterium]|nr:HAD family phosphatase [Clostridia bacterium]